MTLSLPHDYAVETSVLSCLLLKPDLIRRCDFPAAAFYSDFHRDVFDAANELDADHGSFDYASIAARLQPKHGDCKIRVGTICDFVSATKHFDLYVSLLRKIAYQREVARINLLAGENAAAVGADPIEMERERDGLVKIARDTYWPPERALDPLVSEDALREFYGRIETLGLETGNAAFDSVTGALYPGMVITILARPGVGKSALALNMARWWLERGVPWGVLFVSLEMGDTLATDRLMRAVERWNRAETRHAMTANQIPANYRALTEGRWCLYARGSASIAEIAEVKRAWEREHDSTIRAVIVDYMQYLRGEPRESLYEKNSRLSRELKEFAKDADCLVVNLCQVKRGDEGGGGDKCPSLEAGRDSGTIEENADVLIGLWKAKGQGGGGDEERSLRGLKVREGAPGRTAVLWFDPEQQRMG